MAWGHIAPDECPECVGYAAMLYPSDIGRRVCVNGYGPLLVVDTAAAHHRQKLIDSGWVIDLDKTIWDSLGFPERPVAVTVEEC